MTVYSCDNSVAIYTAIAEEIVFCCLCLMRVFVPPQVRAVRMPSRTRSGPSWERSREKVVQMWTLIRRMKRPSRCSWTRTHLSGKHSALRSAGQGITETSGEVQPSCLHTVRFSAWFCSRAQSHVVTGFFGLEMRSTVFRRHDVALTGHRFSVTAPVVLDNIVFSVWEIPD